MKEKHQLMFVNVIKRVPNIISKNKNPPFGGFFVALSLKIGYNIDKHQLNTK